MSVKKTVAVKPAAKPEAAEHVKTLSRRANWLEQRMATFEPSRSGAQHDKKEHGALVWALGELGAAYKPSPFAGVTAEEAGEIPPLRPSEETWSPAEPRGNRYYPGGAL
jgi:hypothetical protein